MSAAKAAEQSVRGSWRAKQTRWPQSTSLRFVIGSVATRRGGACRWPRTRRRHGPALAECHSNSEDQRQSVLVHRKALSSMAKGNLRVIVSTDMLAYGGTLGGLESSGCGIVIRWALLSPRADEDAVSLSHSRRTRCKSCREFACSALIRDVLAPCRPRRARWRCTWHSRFVAAH